MENNNYTICDINNNEYNIHFIRTKPNTDYSYYYKQFIADTGIWIGNLGTILGLIARYYVPKSSYLRFL